MVGMILSFILSPGLVIIGVGMQLGMGLTMPGKVGQGKLLTVPFRAWAAKKAIQRLQKGDVRFLTFLYLEATRSGNSARFVQIAPVWMAFMLLNVVQAFFVRLPDMWFLYGVWLIVLHVDDIFSDTEKWKKKWEAAKNKFKWQPALRPIPVRITP